MKLDLLRVRGERNEVAVLAYEPRRSRNVWLVAGPGYSSSKHNHDVLCSFLSGHGYGVFSLDGPCHKLGASGGRLESIADLTDAMSAVVAFARESHDGPIYTIGHSMGAMTALFVAADNPSIAGAISIATGYGRPSALEALASKGVVTDFRAAYVDGVALPELMRNADEQFDRALARLAGRPQLYVAARRDAMVSVASVEELFRRAQPPKELITIDSDHTFAAENAKADALQWLNRLHPR